MKVFIKEIEFYLQKGLYTCILGILAEYYLKMLDLIIYPFELQKYHNTEQLKEERKDNNSQKEHALPQLANTNTQKDPINH